jgi:hypothetical protein
MNFLDLPRDVRLHITGACSDPWRREMTELLRENQLSRYHCCSVIVRRGAHVFRVNKYWTSLHVRRRRVDSRPDGDWARLGKYGFRDVLSLARKLVVKRRESYEVVWKRGDTVVARVMQLRGGEEAAKQLSGAMEAFFS